MAHKFNPEHKSRLDGPERRKILPPSEILEGAGLRPGDAVADIGAGTGYFSIPAAVITGPRGRVYAVDTSPDMLAALADAAAGAGVSNIEAVHSGEYDFKIVDATADFALMSVVLHEVDDRARLLAESFRILKPGGTLLVIEWAIAGMDMGPPAAERIATNDAVRAVERAGFTDVRTVDYNRYFYFIMARRPGAARGEA
jgi:ubiquinone/menaquinone biosynthesis C-methylase UbiE